MSPRAPREGLLDDAKDLLRQWGDRQVCHALLRTVEVCGSGDDIMVEGVRLPMLRQQNEPYLCMADFVHPQSDTIALFATSIDESLPQMSDADPYQQLLAQTVADRLAEATAEMINREFPGIRPAVGYPSMPDMSLTFLLDRLLDLGQIDIKLTESGAMRPHASVCGIIIPHPHARYFNIGEIGDDQFADYASRRGFTIDEMKKFLPR